MTGALIKAAIVIRAIVFFFIAALLLDVFFSIFLEPWFQGIDSALVGVIALSAIMLSSLALVLADARRQQRKYFGKKT